MIGRIHWSAYASAQAASSTSIMPASKIGSITKLKNGSIITPSSSPIKKPNVKSVRNPTNLNSPMMAGNTYYLTLKMHPILHMLSFSKSTSTLKINVFLYFWLDSAQTKLPLEGTAIPPLWWRKLVSVGIIAPSVIKIEDYLLKIVGLNLELWFEWQMR